VLAGGGTTDPENVLNPCGLVVDAIRSCYRVAIVCRTGDPAILADWYFTDPGALALDVDSAFRSKNWESRDAVAGVVGEQPGARPWKNGKKPNNGYSGNTNSQRCARYHSDWWADGLGPGDETGPFNVSGIPLCCVNGPPPSCVDGEFDVLSAEIIDVAGCGNLGQPSALERESDGVCKWNATYDSDIGTAIVSVDYLGSNNWGLQTTCVDGIVSATASFVSGGTVEFACDDFSSCCTGGSPPRSFTFKVTIP